MIPLARPSMPPVAITSLTWKLLCFAQFLKVGTDGQTDDMSENRDYYLPWLLVGRVDQDMKKDPFQ